MAFVLEHLCDIDDLLELSRFDGIDGLGVSVLMVGLAAISRLKGRSEMSRC